MLDAKDLLEISIDNEIRRKQIRQEGALVSKELLRAAKEGRQRVSIYPNGLVWKNYLYKEVLQELKERGYEVDEHSDIFGNTFYIIDWSNAKRHTY